MNYLILVKSFLPTKFLFIGLLPLLKGLAKTDNTLAKSFGNDNKSSSTTFDLVFKVDNCFFISLSKIINRVSQ